MLAVEDCAFLSGGSMESPMEYVQNQLLKDVLHFIPECYTSRQCPILQDLEGHVAYILAHSKHLSREQVVAELLNDVDAATIRQTRTELFSIACGCYAEYKGTHEAGALKLTQRRGVSARSAQCMDVLSLFLYICALEPGFPTSVLRSPCVTPDPTLEALVAANVSSIAIDDELSLPPADDLAPSPPTTPTLSTPMSSVAQRTTVLEQTVNDLIIRCRDHENVMMDMRCLISNLQADIGTVNEKLAAYESSPPTAASITAPVADGDKDMDIMSTALLSPPSSQNSSPLTPDSSLWCISPVSLTELLADDTRPPQSSPVTPAKNDRDSSTEGKEHPINNNDHNSEESIIIDESSKSDLNTSSNISITIPSPAYSDYESASFHPWQYELYRNKPLPELRETMKRTQVQKDCHDPPCPDKDIHLTKDDMPSHVQSELNNMRTILDEFDDRLLRAEVTLIGATESLDSLPTARRQITESIGDVSNRVTANSEQISELLKLKLTSETPNTNSNCDSHEIPTNNRFTALVDYAQSDNDEMSEGDIRPCDDGEPWVQVTAAKSNRKSKHKLKRKKESKVTIVGDSLVQDFGILVDDEEKGIRACCYPNPGFTAERIQGRLKHLVSAEDDVVVIVGGTNNVPRDSVGTCIQKLDSLIDSAQKLNPDSQIIIAEIPDRYDRNSDMRKIREINSFLQHVCKKSDKLNLIHNDFTREDFGRDGLHFSSSGRQKLAQSIKNAITHR